MLPSFDMVHYAAKYNQNKSQLQLIPSIPIHFTEFLPVGFEPWRLFRQELLALISFSINLGQAAGSLKTGMSLPCG